MIDRCKLEHKENNVVTVTNNNVKYYENLAKLSAEESKKYATKSDLYSKEAIDYTNSHLENEQNPHNVTAEQVGTYSKSEIQTMFAEGLAGKNPNLVSGTNIVITDNDDGTQTISSSNIVSLDYSISENKPSINSVSLVGNKTSHDLGLALLSEVPVKVSDLQNDSGYLTEHQDLSSKQDVLSAGDGISIINNVVSTINRADTDLSNLSDNGKKVIDGQWVSKEQVLSTATAVGTYTLDLSSYLPDDDYDYEVLISTHSHNTVSTNCNIFVGTDLVPNIWISRTVKDGCTRSVNTYILPVGNQRKITLQISLGKATDTNTTAYAFRRIGTNI